MKKSSPMDIWVKVTIEDVGRGEIAFTNNMGQKVYIDLSEIKAKMEENKNEQ